MRKETDVPSSTTRMWQWIGGLGVVYAALYVVGLLALDGNEPGEGASTASLLKYYTAHHASTTAAVFCVISGVVAFGFFLGSLRRRISQGDSEQLALVATMGGAVYVGGLLFGAVTQIALADAARYHAGAALQTLNYAAADDWIPVVAGLALTALACGFAGLRSRALPRWASWASILLGVLALAGPLGGIAFIVTPVWTVALGIVLTRPVRADQQPADQRLATSVPAPAR